MAISQSLGRSACLALDPQLGLSWGLTRVLVSSRTVIRMSTPAPSTRRWTQSSLRPFSVASVLEGMNESAYMT